MLEIGNSYILCAAHLSHAPYMLNCIAPLRKIRKCVFKYAFKSLHFLVTYIKLELRSFGVFFVYFVANIICKTHVLYICGLCSAVVSLCAVL